MTAFNMDSRANSATRKVVSESEEGNSDLALAIEATSQQTITNPSQQVVSYNMQSASEVDTTSDPKKNGEVPFNNETTGIVSTAANGTTPSTSSFPEGGLGAWTVIFGCWCGMFCSFGLINCIGVFEAYFTSEDGPLHEYSQGTVSWITSFQTFGLTFGGIIFGPIYDRFGPRWLLITGSIVNVFGLMMVSISHKYYQFFLAQGVVAAFGSSAVFNACMSSAVSWFLRRRAFAFAIMVSGSSVGGIIMPIMVSKLIPHIGFGWTMRAVSFMILGLLVITVSTVRSRLPPSPKPFNIEDYFSGLREPPYALTCIGAFLFYWGLFLPFNYIILQAENAGMDPGTSAYLLPIINAVSIPGRIIAGYIGDKMGRYNVTVVVAGLTSVICLGLWIPGTSQGAIITFAVLYGFSSGSFISLAPTLIAQISDIRHIGVRQGTCFMIQSFAALTGSPIAGAIVSSQKGAFTGLQIFCGCSLMASMIAYSLARIVQAGFRPVKV